MHPPNEAIDVQCRYSGTNSLKYLPELKTIIPFNTIQKTAIHSPTNRIAAHMKTYRVWRLRNCIITVDLMEVPEYFFLRRGVYILGGYEICIDTTLSWYSNGKFGALAMFCVLWVPEARLVFATWRVRNPYREWTIIPEANARHAWWWCAATLEDRVLKKKSCR